MRNFKYAFAAAAALGAVALGSSGASAMPNGLPSISKALSQDVQDVRWVCGPYRCRWVPNWYGAYGFYGGPRVYGGPRFYGGPRAYGPGPRWGGHGRRW
jgi:hypothetical protein